MAQPLVVECGVGHAHAVVAEESRILNRIAVSVLNYNSARSTIECIESLLLAEKGTSGKCQLEIYISDNASGEEDQRQLQVFLEKIATLQFQINVENLGFSAGHNRNLARIFADSSPDYVWLLNNDCLVAETALGTLVECAQNSSDVGIWGATLLEADCKTIQCAGGCFYNTWISSYRQYGQGKPLARLAQLVPVKYDYIAGASLFFPVETLKSGLMPIAGVAKEATSSQQQWLNEDFFLYFEELDLAKRLKPGLKMAWCTGALITHTAGSSTGTSDNRRSSLAEYHSTLSALKFTYKYYPYRLWAMAPARFVSKSLLLLVRREFRLIGVMLKAYRDFRRD